MARHAAEALLGGPNPFFGRRSANDAFRVARQAIRALSLGERDGGWEDA